MEVHVCGKKPTEQMYIHIHFLKCANEKNCGVHSLHADWLPGSGLYCFSPPDVENIFSSCCFFV